MKTIPITLKVPAFLLSPWAWGPLVLILGFSLGVRLLPPRAVAQEAKQADAGRTAPARVGRGVMIDGYPVGFPIPPPRILPCGHPESGSIVGGYSDSHWCAYGHRFRPYGTWYVPE